jgi:hypothetical protein
MEVNKHCYEARHVDFDSRLKSLITLNYRVFKRGKSIHHNCWASIKSINEYKNIENIFMIPEEKIGTEGYERFK